MKTQSIAYIVPTWTLSYLVNGDMSGFTDEEEAGALAFESNCIETAKEAGASHWHFATDEESQEYFAPCNEVTGRIGGDVEQINLVMFFGEVK